MANLIKYSTASAWTDGLFGASAADLNIASFINGYGVLGSGTIANGAGDLWADFSFRCTAISPSAGAYLSLYQLGLLDDGSTYVDGESGSTAANQPTLSQLVSRKILRLKASAAQNVLFENVRLLAGTVKFYLLNGGPTLPSTGTVFKYRTYSLNNNA